MEYNRQTTDDVWDKCSDTDDNDCFSKILTVDVWDKCLKYTTMIVSAKHELILKL